MPTKPNVIKNLESIAPILPAPIYWLDTNSVFLGANNHTLKAIGASCLEELIGKTSLEIWPNHMAEKIVRHNKEVVLKGQTLSQEEVITDLQTGEIRYFTVLKSPLRDEDGKIIGLVGNSIEITAEKEAERLQRIAERLQYENEIKMQRLIVEEKEKLITLAHKVAHDISSPLSALNMMMQFCDELPESKRSMIKRATESILDISNNLLNNYRNEEPYAAAGVEQPQPVLISDLIVQLLSEKKLQYHSYPIAFKTTIASDAHFAFAHLQATELRRAMSNLINNAADALKDKNDGVITIQLIADADSVIVKVHDNGKGMSRDKVEKILERQSFTDGKENGHGLGLQQIWDTLECNQGTMAVRSDSGKGTTIQLTFPRIAASTWIAQEIHLATDNIVVILDDDESIHTAWDLRFASLLNTYLSLRLYHFKQGQQVLDFLDKLTSQEKDCVLFLSDYELLRQDKNGLQIIEASQIKGATLVTSYYANPKIGEAATQLNVKILPKQMASVIPIKVNIKVNIRSA